MSIIYWLRKTLRHLQKKTVPLRTIVVNEAPEPLQPNLLYLVGTRHHPWAVIFLCPSGCKAAIELNLLPEARPCWRIRKHWDSTVTLYPSVDRVTGCKSHFWIRRGTIEWVTFRSANRSVAL